MERSVKEDYHKNRVVLSMVHTNPDGRTITDREMVLKYSDWISVGERFFDYIVNLVASFNKYINF